MIHANQDAYGNITYIEIPDVQTPLDVIGVMATINAIINPDYLEDYARAVNLTPDDLINEAQAWAVAMEVNDANS